MLFAAIWFFIGAIDDIAVDFIWLWHICRSRYRKWAGHDFTAPGIDPEIDTSGFAIFIPAWQESDVIGHMLAHCHAAWPDDDIRIYVGCYPNDEATIDKVCHAAFDDPRINLVINERDGPTSKADCLNQMWRQLCRDEADGMAAARAVILHDAEDIVHADSLKLFAQYLQKHDYVQIPVVPLVNSRSRWVSGHYCDEFAEAHAKAMVVRGAVAAGLPAAGVGCAFSRAAMLAVTRQNVANGDAASPFASDSLTEDYELGLRINDMGGSGVFVRARCTAGDLIATSEYFPADIGAAARQKSRWMAGIALLGWDRLGWRGNFAEKWMRLRDRRAVLAALVLCAAYFAMFFITMTAIGQWFGAYRPGAIDPALAMLLLVNAVILGWRMVFRFAFTTAQYGLVEGLLSLPRIFIANIIAIMAARRALAGYIGELRGSKLHWEKTSHIIVERAVPAKTAKP